ncbi:tRNA lysidine(34) synthetase TilS [Roseovarius sp. SCSIO 43702]|nr:tRNA lysidine(34) synthetase TilS [Roseovarius sp. SCSIO 43702]
MQQHFEGRETPARVAVAVSGGSDSTALLLAARDWAAPRGVAVAAVTVDHGLRPEAAHEAAEVAALCARLGVAHDTLHWRGWDGRGNLPEAARRARYDLMAEWVRAGGVADILLGHTADDQAETLVMRMARSAGLDGLAGMAARVAWGDVTLHRPFLALRRSTLRDWLRDRGVGWSEDPTNEDARFRRVATRRALDALAQAGVSVEALVQVAAHLREARDTLAHHAVEVARGLARFEAGDVLFDAAGWAALRPDLQRRLLQAALRWVGGGDHGPRGATLDAALDSLRAGRGTVLAGCRVWPVGGAVRVTREARAVEELEAAPGEAWDGRWRLSGPARRGDRVRALGEAQLGLCPDRAGAGVPAATLTASPALWREGRLIAAPLAGLGPEWSLEMLRPEALFFELLRGDSARALNNP